MATTKKAPAVKKSAVKAPAKSPSKAQLVQPIYQQPKIDWRSLYLYAVCLITLMVCLFSLVSFIRSGVNFVYPDPAYVDPYATKPQVNSALIAAQVKDQNQRQAVKSMIDSVTTLIIAGPLYVYHWRLARK
ncbi:MAG: hypothetical protein EBR75_03430 [Actinobacteria bacterium]|nr:hypothetical protein [Actinomycetota bacterium]